MPLLGLDRADHQQRAAFRFEQEIKPLRARRRFGGSNRLISVVSRHEVSSLPAIAREFNKSLSCHLGYTDERRCLVERLEEIGSELLAPWILVVFGESDGQKIV